jgi:hypothetical protein
MTRATKKQLDEAKKLIIAGEWPSQVSKKTGVSPATCQAISNSLKEPTVTSRPMNEEEIKKYGSHSKDHVTPLEKPEDEKFKSN